MAAWETSSTAFHLVLGHLLEKTLGILEIQSRTEKMQKEVGWGVPELPCLPPPPTEIWSTTYKKCSALVSLNSASDKPGSYGNLKTLGFDSESNRLSFVHQKPLLRLVKRCCHTLLPQSTPGIWVSSPALCPSSPQGAIHTKVLIPGGRLC